MTKDREERKKEKKEKKEKQERKERKEKKRREAEELAVREKKISKKHHKSKSKEPEKPEKSKKKSKKHEVEEEEQSPKKSKESKKKHKRSDESEEEPQTQIVDSNPVTVPIVTTNNNESDSDFESDKEDLKNLLESYSKEELINLIYKTAEKGSKLMSAVFESADRECSQRNIFVRGLGWDTTHENLKAAFEVYGEIEDCSVVMDKDTGRAKGYGFVLFKTRKGAREALRNPEKRMYNRTVSCSLAKPPGTGKVREPVESVKIDLTHTANQSEMAFPGVDMAHGHGLDKGHPQLQNMPMYAGQNMPFYGHSQPPGFNPMYGPMMGNQGAMMGNQMVAGLPNYRMFGSGMMNQGPMVPPNHMGMSGQYVGDGNVNGVGVSAGAGAGTGFDGERAWYLR